MKTLRAVTTASLALGLAMGSVLFASSGVFVTDMVGKGEVAFAEDDSVLLADEDESYESSTEELEPQPVSVSYVNERCEINTEDACFTLDANKRELKEGWHVLNDNVCYSEPLIIEGNVRLILTGNYVLEAMQGIRIKKDATLTVYAQKDASASVLVRKGIVLELTKDQQVEEDQRLARMRELDPTYHEEEPQILFVWPCLEVTAGDNEPSSDPNHEFDPEHDPKQIEKPELKAALLGKDYLVIRPHASHSMYEEDGFVVVNDNHVTCTRCDGWFEDLEGHMPMAKPVSEVAMADDVEEASLRAESSDEEMVTVTFDANGGSGSMEPMQVKAGEGFVLPECAYEPPSGMVFSQWSLGKPGSTVSVPSSITVRAWWKQGSTTPDDGGQDSSQSNQGANNQQSNAQNTANNSSSQSTQTTNGSSPNTGDPTTSLSDIAGVLIVCGLVLVFFGKTGLMFE